MISIDTNVLVRLLTKDDSNQANQATFLFQKNSVFISKTVLLETEWVLRNAYNLKKNVIFKAFLKILGLQNVTVEDSDCIKQALELYEKNWDFADALHVASSIDFEHPSRKFATFDKKLFKKGKQLKTISLVIP